MSDLKAEQIAAIREQHWKDGDFCEHCGDVWPCDAAALLAAFDSQQARIAQLESALTKLTNAVNETAPLALKAMRATLALSETAEAEK